MILNDVLIQDLDFIQPFVAQKTGDISYGLSSYGYDVRLAEDIRMCDAELTTSLDPKSPHLNSAFWPLTPERQGTILLPPHSFSLAHTVETISMPPDVFALCVGKSTYARCFSGDTRVALVDGSAPTFVELIERAEAGEQFWGYSTDSSGIIQVSELVAPRLVGYEPTLEVELDDGAVVRCTPDHKFMLKSGEFVQAQTLSPGDSLMPLYRTVARGYEGVYQPAEGRVYSTHWLADLWNVRHGVYPEKTPAHRHHKSGDKRDNRPCNIERLSPAAHIRGHNASYYGASFDPQAHGEKVAAAYNALSSDADWVMKYRSAQAKKATRLWSAPELEDARQKLRDFRSSWWTDDRRQAAAARMHTRYANPHERAAQGERQKAAWGKSPPERRAAQAELLRALRTRSDVTEESYHAALEAAGSRRGAARLLGCDRSVFRRFENHKVSRVSVCRGEEPVYCLTAPEFGNFALNAGVFVHNCGLVVNTTPIEPGWSGQITLELSNTTPVPIRVYPGEGIAQLVFFRGQHPRRPYGTGKYQDQEGIVFPRVG